MRKRFMAGLVCTCVLLATAARAEDAAAASGFVPYDQKTFDQGVAAYDAGRYDEAFKIFSGLAEHEDLGAMRNVAYMERKGLGTPKDPKAALDLYYYVANAGLATAQFDYAEMLLDGEAGDRDPKAALPWLVMACNAGHPIAQFRLGQLYEYGDVVPQDLFRAKLLYAAAAERGERRALERLSYLNGWPAPPPVPAKAQAQTASAPADTAPSAPALAPPTQQPDQAPDENPSTSATAPPVDSAVATPAQTSEAPPTDGSGSPPSPAGP